MIQFALILQVIFYFYFFYVRRDSLFFALNLFPFNFIQTLSYACIIIIL